MGLNDKEVSESRKLYGTNSITQHNNNSFFRLLLESFSDPIIKILLIALAIKVVFLFSNFDWYETIGILIAIFLASFISTISEYGSEQAFIRLQEESANIKCRVYRNNILSEISISDIVVGDLVELSFGDKVPADGIIIKGSISIDESSLNGEAKEIKKTSKLNENKVYRGTVVYSGNAIMKINAVGDKTIYGKISKELQEKVPDSPLKIKLRALATTISKIGYIGSILASLSYLFSVIVINNNFDINLIQNTLHNFPLMINHLIYAITLSVTIIVVAVPEGLPMMITLVLSSNMKKMLKDNVLVRKLVGIETAGSLNILLTDKTGTLTKGILKVIKFINYEGKEYNSLDDIHNNTLNDIIYKSMYYNNESTISDNKIIGGNSTDRAILDFVKIKRNINVNIINKEIFNSVNKYSSVTLNDGAIFIKGAAEVILPKCKSYLDNDGNVNNNFQIKKIKTLISKLTNNSSRIIVFAYGKNKDKLTFIGITEIKDELRKQAVDALRIIKGAGIHTIMITGDSVDTAASIAKEVGLINNYKNRIIDSTHFNKMSDEEIKKEIFNISVIARALPQDKSRLVSLIEEMDLVVGMTGDGVNDAPALKKANVGFAMGSGTEVAKEAADIVILDNNILSISKAICYGRTIFKSIRRFIIYQLTVNISALILSIIGSFIGISTPITIVQMLWLNMIMDTFAGLAFSYEPSLDEYMEEKPKKKNEKIMNKYMYSQIIWNGLYSALLCILFLKLPLFKIIIRNDSNNKYLMTAYFAMFIYLGIFNAFNARTERINILANITKNKVFLIIFTLIFVAQTFIIYYGGEIFRTYGLTLKELIIVLILSISILFIDFIRKIVLKKHYINFKI